MTMKALVDEMAMADGLKEVRAALNAILTEAQRLEDENGVLKAQIEELEKAHSLA
jgi:cell division septum initiation protein DivIVA